MTLVPQWKVELEAWRWRRPPAWVGWLAAAVAALLALPWALALYARWWDLAFRAGSFVEAVMPAVGR